MSKVTLEESELEGIVSRAVAAALADVKARTTLKPGDVVRGKAGSTIPDVARTSVEDRCGRVLWVGDDGTRVALDPDGLPGASMAWSFTGDEFEKVGPFKEGDRVRLVGRGDDLICRRPDLNEKALGCLGTYKGTTPSTTTRYPGEVDVVFDLPLSARFWVRPADLRPADAAWVPQRFKVGDVVKVNWAGLKGRADAAGMVAVVDRVATARPDRAYGEFPSQFTGASYPVELRFDADEVEVLTDVKYKVGDVVTLTKSPPHLDTNRHYVPGASVRVTGLGTGRFGETRLSLGGVPGASGAHPYTTPDRVRPATTLETLAFEAWEAARVVEYRVTGAERDALVKYLGRKTPSMLREENLFELYDAMRNHSSDRRLETK